MPRKLSVTLLAGLLIVVAGCVAVATPTPTPTPGPKGPGWYRIRMVCTFQGPTGAYWLSGTHIISGAEANPAKLCPPGLRNKATGRVDPIIEVGVTEAVHFDGPTPMGLSEGIFMAVPNGMEMLPPEVPTREGQ